MDEILQKVLQSELLSEETKADISEQWKLAVSDYKVQLREEVEQDVKHLFEQQWIQERDELVETVDKYVSEALVKELAELRGDIDRFRDLEVESARKIVEEKERLAEQVAAELDELVDKIDMFFEHRLEEEFKELQEDIEIVKQNEFGRQLYETFADAFAKVHVNEDHVSVKLRIAEDKLRDAEQKLAESERAQEAALRESKLETVLSSLSGKKREQMKVLLSSVDTDKLEESYEFFIGRVLKESDDSTKSTQLLEDKAISKKTTVMTGNLPVDNSNASVLNEGEVARMRRLAGIR